MRILHYTGTYAPAWVWGGPPRSTSNLAEGLVALGHEVAVFTTNAGLTRNLDIPTGVTVDRNGVAVKYFKSIVGPLGIRSEGLRNAIRTDLRRFDIVHVTGVWQTDAVAACRACVRSGIPYVISPRGALSVYSFSRGAVKKWLYWRMFERSNLKTAAAVHVTSTIEAVEIRRLRLGTRTFILPNAIDTRSWRRDVVAGYRWRERLLGNRAAGAFVCLYVGRLHHKKGLQMLPGVFRQLVDLDWHFVAVGFDEDGTGAELRHAFGMYGMEKRFSLLEHSGSEGVVDAYSGGDVMLFPSLHENFGNVAVEALACGCPVIISDQVGAADHIADLSGVVVAPRSDAAWSAAIMRIARTKMEVDCEAVARMFDSRTIATRMAMEYQRCIT